MSNLKDGLQLPAPTSAPLFFALGLALLFAGLVSHPLVSAVGGGFALAGVFGWWRAVLPEAREVTVALQPEDQRARPIEPRPHAVEHLVAGEGRHRLRLPVEVRPLSSGLRGGLAGAAAMAAIACSYGWLAHGSPWFPINVLAGSVLPAIDQETGAHLMGFDGTAFVLASFIHLSLSLSMGVVYAALLPMLPGRPLVWGGVVAPLVWTGLSWSALGMLNPSLEEFVSWPWFIASQIGFGLAAGIVITHVEPIATLQSRSLVERAGFEGSGLSAPREQREERE